MRTHAGLLVGLILLAAASVFSVQRVVAADDERELVELPAMMQDHMLANMRDHLAAIDEILAAMAGDHVGTAAETAENRLGMSSLSLHGAEHIARFIPPEMGEIGTRMHRAASRFAIIVRDAELDPGAESQRKVYAALRDITQNCNACHAAYRIR